MKLACEDCSHLRRDIYSWIFQHHKLLPEKSRIALEKILGPAFNLIYNISDHKTLE